MGNLADKVGVWRKEIGMIAEEAVFWVGRG